MNLNCDFDRLRVEFGKPDHLNRLCHTTAPMPIYVCVLIAFGMGLVVHSRVNRAHIKAF